MSVRELISHYHAGREIIFDLDNTIYPEYKFLFLAYEKIAEKSSSNAKEIYGFLKDSFLLHGRENLFDNLVREYPENNLTVKECLSILRNVKCNKCIQPYVWFKNFIAETSSQFKLKIITNGNIQQQKNKVVSINFGLPMERIEIVFAHEYAPKPNRCAYYQLNNYTKFTSPVYVGDSITDVEFCKTINIDYFDANILMCD